MQLSKSFSHTSPILTGVPPRLGMHGRGQRSRHSGCETTLQSRHFSEILPNLILFPQGTQDSGLMTYKVIRQILWLWVNSNVHVQLNAQITLL